jgi:hypothetical protein
MLIKPFSHALDIWLNQTVLDAGYLMLDARRIVNGYQESRVSGKRTENGRQKAEAGRQTTQDHRPKTNGDWWIE